ncbi:esterase/lipase family protein [Gulosibacter chungangensis]|uniref:esterase/lipase family protein n=1 Tax=Gulosibacter chungangensis TaxID=979746 RepID=UPI001787FDCB|nr:alpha/beta hydrolase [Gulosibacter chungangensis]
MGRQRKWLQWYRLAWWVSLRGWASIVDSLYWALWQVRASGLRLRRALWGRRATLLTAPAKVDPNKPVIVALAGLATSWEFLTPLIDGLTRRGFQVAVLPQLGHNLSSVPELAEYVKRFLRTHDDLSPVMFVTHSKGGLIAKRVLLDDPDWRYAVGAVVLAAPFAGATSARHIRGLTKFGKEIITLRPGTPSQLELEHMDAQDSRISSISPLYDEVVGIRGRVRGGSNRAVSALGHNRFLSDERLHALVEREVNRLWSEWQVRQRASTTTPPTPA